MTKQLSLANLISAFSKEVNRWEDNAQCARSFTRDLKKSARYIAESPLHISGYFQPAKQGQNPIDTNMAIDMDGYYVYYETIADNQWHIQQFPSQESVENFILDSISNPNISCADIYAFFNGQIQEYTLGRILEDGTKVELDVEFHNFNDAIVYWGDIELEEMTEEMLGEMSDDERNTLLKNF